MRPPRIRSSFWSFRFGQTRPIWLAISCCILLTVGVYTIILVRFSQRHSASIDKPPIVEIRKDVKVPLIPSISSDTVGEKRTSQIDPIQMGEKRSPEIDSNQGDEKEAVPKGSLIEINRVKVEVENSAEKRAFGRSEFQFPFEMGRARLVTYRKASSVPQCDLSRVYYPLKLVSGLPDGQSSSFECKIKSASRDSTHGTGMHCHGRFIGFDPRAVQVSRGGEDVYSVLGRREEEENARVSTGAFFLAKNPSGSTSSDCDTQKLNEFQFDIGKLFFMAPLLQSICTPVATAKCDSFDPIATMIVHRFEYVNLYHTATELLSAYVSLQTAIEAGLVQKNEKVRIIFLDGHASGTLDDLWTDLFSNHELETWRVGSLKDLNRPLCFERLIIAEIGYAAEVNIHGADANIFNSPISHRDVSNSNWCVFQTSVEFANQVAKLGKEYEKPIDWKKPLVLFIARDRGSKPAHPRVAMGAGVERSSSGSALEQLVERAKLISSRGKFDLRVVFFSEMPFKQQVGLIRSAAVVMSFHGAALTHLLWCKPETLFVELAPSEYLTRMHFPKMAARNGRYFARLTSGGSGRDFLSGGGHTINFTPDMLESVAGWSLISDDDTKLKMTEQGGSHVA